MATFLRAQCDLWCLPTQRSVAVISPLSFSTLPSLNASFHKAGFEYRRTNSYGLRLCQQLLAAQQSRSLLWLASVLQRQPGALDSRCLLCHTLWHSRADSWPKFRLLVLPPAPLSPLAFFLVRLFIDCFAVFFNTNYLWEYVAWGVGGCVFLVVIAFAIFRCYWAARMRRKRLEEEHNRWYQSPNPLRSLPSHLANVVCRVVVVVCCLLTNLMYVTQSAPRLRSARWHRCCVASQAWLSRQIVAKWIVCLVVRAVHCQELG